MYYFLTAVEALNCYAMRWPVVDAILVSEVEDGCQHQALPYLHCFVTVAAYILLR
jgi:hypothetical protein